MKKITLSALLLLAGSSLLAQSNIYKIKAAMLQDGAIKDKNETREIEHGEDDNMAKFNRWFALMEPRCYPSGDVPGPDVLLNAWKPDNNNRTAGYKKTGSVPNWQPIGPIVTGEYAIAIGRVNCITVNPADTNIIYIGTAGGGLFISHNGGKNWKSNSDNFPSLSVAAIAVNPLHPDTIYAATGDEYGYESYSYNIFWGGLYSAGVIMSSDGGNTWHTTGMSYLQSDRQIVQSLLIHPHHPNILLAGTRNGIYRSTDAGATWKNVDTNQHVYSMAFKPDQPDTVYAANDSNLKVSYDAGASWQNIYYGINSPGSYPTDNRTTIAVSPAAPNDVWAVDNNGNLMISRNGGSSFFAATSPAPYAMFYGYYGNVIAVSPVDSNFIICGGVKMTVSKDGGASWHTLDTAFTTHPDNHAFAFNPLNAATFYSGNDGGLFVTHDNGSNWANLNDSLMISQIYRTSSSQQNPYMILCGLQDNSTYRFDGSNWTDNIGGDGEACAISPADDNIQIGSYQYGNFFLSYDQGNTFNSLYIGPGSMGAWTAPVVFSPGSADTIYFGLKDVYATYDGGYTFTSLGSGIPMFPNGIISLAVAPSNPHVIYAADYSHIVRSDDGGATWNDVSGHLTPDSLAITRIAVAHNDPRRVYVTTSGYASGKKVYASATGGTAWTNISYNLPNVPANCIAVDSSVIGAIYVGTDMGLYYMDSSMTGWTSYGKGLPNVIVDDLDINYNVRKIRAATYGRGLWEADLQARNARGPIAVPKVVLQKAVKVYPNPTEDSWQLIFKDGMPKNYHVVVHDMAGKTLYEADNVSVINASGLKAGNYIIDVNVNGNNYNIKASHK